MNATLRETLAWVCFLHAIILIIASRACALSAINAWKQAGRQWLVILASLYPLGKAFQQEQIVPQWIRFYISDVGFIPYFAVVVGSICCMAVYLLRREKGPFRFWCFRRAIRRTTYAGWFVAVSVELLQLAIQPAVPTKEFSARGDVVDLVIFCIMLAVTLGLVQLATDAPKPLSDRAASQPPGR